MSFDASELAGLRETQLVDYQGQRLRPEVLRPLEELQQEAHSAGFEFTIASSYRSFHRQQCIWDQKAQGLRPLLSDAGDPLCYEQLNTEQVLWAILRWSALPGSSRHHWGTDFDVYDARALGPGQTLQLTVAETVGNGPFAEFHRWLDTRLALPNCPFFRPYTRPLGGVAPEPWHLSYAPVAAKMQRQLGLTQLRNIVAASDIALKDKVLEHIEDIFARFVWVPWELYPVPYRDAGA